MRTDVRPSIADSNRRTDWGSIRPERSTSAKRRPSSATDETGSGASLSANVRRRAESEGKRDERRPSPSHDPPADQSLPPVDRRRIPDCLIGQRLAGVPPACRLLVNLPRLTRSSDARPSAAC
jgi:hypothetical protein